VHSATRPKISSPTFGAPGRGLGLKFLLVFLFDTMVHITEHRDETSEVFPMEEEAASSMMQSSGRPTLGVAAVRPARQHTPVQASQTPSGVAPARALSAARELLRHPPRSTASPGAIRQWRDDVDRLLSMAHSGSVRPRPRSSRRQYEASVAMRSPSVRAAPTKDLRAELNRRRAVEDPQVPPETPEDPRDKLNRRHAGKDACISLERERERCGNLEQDFAAVAPWAPGDARF
jgi:hypothetical protein